MNTSVDFDIKSKLALLEESLLAANPNMPVVLREIHSILKKDPEVVTILSEEDVSLIVRGLKKQTNTEIATKVAKKKMGSKKALSKITVDDL